MTRILGTGNQKGFSLVEVLITILIISTSYVIIAKGLIETLAINKRINSYSQQLLISKQYFEKPESVTNDKIEINKVKDGKHLEIHSITFNEQNKLMFKGYVFATNQ